MTNAEIIDWKARAEKAEAEVKRLERDLDGMGEMLHAAERERDELRERARAAVERLTKLSNALEQDEEARAEKAEADLAALNLCEPHFLDRILRERDEWKARAEKLERIRSAASALSSGASVPQPSSGEALPEP